MNAFFKSWGPLTITTSMLIAGLVTHLGVTYANCTGAGGGGWCLTGDIVPCNSSGCITYAAFTLGYGLPNDPPLCYGYLDENGELTNKYASYVKVTAADSWAKCATTQDQEIWCSCVGWRCATSVFFDTNQCVQAAGCPESNDLPITRSKGMGSLSCGT